jgi:hypothetical protein
VQVAVPTAGPVIEVLLHVSLEAKPVPITDIDAPIGPEEGDRVTTCGVINSVALAETVPSFAMIPSLSPVNVVTTTKEPDNV